MKKILSCVLAAAMLVGMLTFGVASETPDQVLKFNDILAKGGGGDAGMANYSGAGISKSGYTLVMDFVFGRSGICYHPTDSTMKHSSKFALMLGSSNGTNKYVGYSATDDVFFVGTCVNAPMYGEGADGIEYLVDSYDPEHMGYSEKGLIQPGVEYTIAYEFIMDTGINIYVDGVQVLSFDLYDDLEYPTYFPHESLMMYPTHMTCFIDDVALYEVGTYNAETGEASADPLAINNFETDAEMKEVEEKDEEGNVTGTAIKPVVKNWNVAGSGYTLADPANDVYAQPQYVPAEGQANIVFQSGLDKKANGADEVFASGMDFNIDLTIKNNKGIDSVVLDLVSDPYITVKSVQAAEGLTATLGETDENGVTKLTVSGSNYTGEALATLTYSLSADAVQDFGYNYGAKTATAAVTGASSDAVITNGSSVVYNYTVGDPNEDGKFNLRDVTLILKIVAKWDLPGVFSEAADVNADGRSNSMDASYYLRWLAKWAREYTINGITYY